MPCIFRIIGEQSRLIRQLIENLQQKDLNPVEEARAFKRLMDELNLTQRDLAQRLGKSLTAVNQTTFIEPWRKTWSAVCRRSLRVEKNIAASITHPAPKCVIGFRILKEPLNSNNRHFGRVAFHIDES